MERATCQHWKRKAAHRRLSLVQRRVIFWPDRPAGSALLLRRLRWVRCSFRASLGNRLTVSLAGMGQASGSAGAIGASFTPPLLEELREALHVGFAFRYGHAFSL